MEKVKGGRGAAALMHSDMCGGPKKGRLPNSAGREGDASLLPGPFEAGQISNTALATSLA